MGVILNVIVMQCLIIYCCVMLYAKHIS